VGSHGRVNLWLAVSGLRGGCSGTRFCSFNRKGSAQDPSVGATGVAPAVEHHFVAIDLKSLRGHAHDAAGAANQIK
jgi:hypothetical protein